MMTFEPHVQALLTQAVNLHRQNQLENAAALYDQILQTAPEHGEALHLLGVIRTQQGEFRQATVLIEKSLQLAPKNARAWANLGHTWLQAHNPLSAVSALDRALALDPQYSRARLWHAMALQKAGQPYAALDSCQQLLKAEPALQEAWQLMARMLADICQFAQAQQVMDKALQALPAPDRLYRLRDQINQEQFAHQQWLAQQLGPVGLRAPQALRNLMQAHYARHNHQEAVRVGQTLVASNPKDTQAYMLLGQLWSLMQQPLSAIECFDRVTMLSPGHVEAHFRCGLALYTLNKHMEALEQFECALDADPGHIDSLYFRASSLLHLKRLDQAIGGFLALEQMAPDHPQLQGELLSAMLSAADWSQFQERRNQLLQATIAGKPVSQPFFVIHIADTLEAQLKAAQQWSRLIARDLATPAPFVRKLTASKDRLRIAYFSMDFRNHPLAYLTAGLFEKHARDEFELHIFDYGPQVQDEMQQRISNAAEHYHRIEQTSMSSVVNLARELKLDVAIDLAGHTANARHELFQQRVAPVQIAYLGYPGTSGAPWIDYIIGDPWVTPRHLRAGYSEKIIELPFFQVNDDDRRISDRTFNRHELGIPENHFLFCCLNSTPKINPEIFSVWMRILKAVPQSSLLLYAHDEAVKSRLGNTATSWGIYPQRLVFAQWLPAAEYLARFKVADLFLDTFPFNAGTTASDALWAGLPVLTCSGQAYASRMAGSLLHNLGLPELVTESLEAYEAKAIALGHDRHQMAALRQRLAQNRTEADAFKTARMTRYIEEAYRQAVARSRAGQPPTHLRVNALPASRLSSA